MQLTFSCLLCESSVVSRDYFNYLSLCICHKREVGLLNRAFANSDLFNKLCLNICVYLFW